MRKILIALAAVAILSLLGGAVAFADNGPHGNYADTVSGVNDEDGCAGCHRAHTGYTNLLIKSSEYELCVTCHSGIGGGLTNVLDGLLMATTPAALNGGAFGSGTTVISSKHSVNASPVVTAIPDSSVGPMTSIGGLQCSSCHDPHGKTVGVTEQYRMLRGGPGGAWGTLVESNEGATEVYTDTAWKSGTTEFCASCHDLDTGNSAPPTGVDRHPVNMTLGSYTTKALSTVLPMQDPDPAVLVTGDEQVVCMTCHKPHGTTTANTAGGWSAGVGSNAYDRIPTSVVDDGGNTYLLRFDNRGVCQDCHQK